MICPQCKGAKRVAEDSPSFSTSFNYGVSMIDCETCGGVGEVPDIDEETRGRIAAVAKARGGDTMGAAIDAYEMGKQDELCRIATQFGLAPLSANDLAYLTLLLHAEEAKALAINDTELAQRVRRMITVISIGVASVPQQKVTS